MSKDIVQRLRDLSIDPDCENFQWAAKKAADLIEAQAAEIKWREDETAHEVVAARDCEKYERERAEAAEAEVKRLREALTVMADITSGDAYHFARKALEQ